MVDLNLNQVNIHDFSNSEFVENVVGTVDNKVIIGNNKDLSLSWGTTTNDTHFINFQETLPPEKRNKGVNSDYNVAHYENRFTFITFRNTCWIWIITFVVHYIIIIDKIFI